MSDLKPIVQWVGGKTRLLNEIVDKIPKNINNYHEIFLGGGTLLFSLCPNNAYCYELNEVLCIIYNCIKDKDNSVKLIEELTKISDKYFEIPVTDKENRKKYYIDIRNKFNKLKLKEIKEDNDKLNIAVYFKFINKTCFNALYRENKNGEFNVPFGNGKDKTICDCENINKINKYFNSNNIIINNIDFEKSINNIKKGDFVYIDPPYYPLNKKSFTSYTKEGFNEKDHERLIKYCKKLNEMGVNFMLSNSNCDYIKNNFKEDCYTIKEISISRTLSSDVSSREKKKVEVIIINY